MKAHEQTEAAKAVRALSFSNKEGLGVSAQAL